MFWNLSKLCDLTGQVAIVTGGNAGIGYETSLGLGKRGCTVIIASRSEERGMDAVDKLRSQVENGKFEFMKLDLASFESVRQFAAAFFKKNIPLHMLICNAGVAYLAYSLTEDEIATTIQTNFLSHCLLEHLLEKKLIASSTQEMPSRIVNVSSELGFNARIVWVQWEKNFPEQGYDKVAAYRESKKAQCLWTWELSSRLKDKGVLVNVAHPGYAKTEIMSKFDKDIRSTMLKLWIDLVGQSVKNGAISSLHAAASKSVVWNMAVSIAEKTLETYIRFITKENWSRYVFANLELFVRSSDRIIRKLKDE